VTSVRDVVQVAFLVAEVWQEAGDELAREVTGGGGLRRSVVAEQRQENARVMEELGVADLIPA
jgi:hypothetical protein